MDAQQRFFVGTYSKSEGDIFTLWLDREHETLKIGPIYTGCIDPSFLALRGDCLYSVSERPNGGAVVSYHAAPDGTLTPTARLDAPYPGLCHVCIWPKQNAVSFASYSGSGALTCATDDSGVLTAITQWLPNSGHGVNPVRQEQAHVHSLTADAAGRFMIEADLGIDQLRIFIAGDGVLLPHADISVPAGEGPRHFIFHPNGRYAYLVTELLCRVLFFDYDAENGMLALQESYDLLDGSEPENSTAADIHLTPNTKYLYASVRGTPHLIRFAVNDDGTLSGRTFTPCGASAVRNFCINTKGAYLLVADQNANEVRLFAIHPETGDLSVCLSTVSIPSPVCIINA